MASAKAHGEWWTNLCFDEVCHIWCFHRDFVLCIITGVATISVSLVLDFVLIYTNSFEFLYCWYSVLPLLYILFYADLCVAFFCALFLFCSVLFAMAQTVHCQLANGPTHLLLTLKCLQLQLFYVFYCIPWPQKCRKWHITCYISPIR